VIKTVDSIGIVQSQEAEKVAHLSAGFGRALGNVEVQQFMQQSTLKHEST
jgi:hypothetical protein